MVKKMNTKKKKVLKVSIDKNKFPNMTEDEIVKAFADMIDLGGGYTIEKNSKQLA
jgi:hypothetical protein